MKVRTLSLNGKQAGEPCAETRPTIRPRMRPRWQKVFSDLWSNKIRTVLVVASVAVGLFAVGMMTTIHDILTSDIRAGYAAVNPTNIMVNAYDFDDDMVKAIRRVDGVKDAEGVRSVDLMARTGPDQWSRITLQAIPDFHKMNINRVQLIQGIWPPDDHEIVVERTKLSELIRDAQGQIEVKLPSGKIRKLKVVGVVHDQTVGIASIGGGFFMAPIQGFINRDTLPWLDQPDAFNLLYATVKDQPDDEDHIRNVANDINDAMEDNHGLTYNAIIRGTHDHPNRAYVDAITGILVMLGLLVVFLSGFLITNTLSALLNQQAQQIGIMKTVGARSLQVTGIYMALIGVFGLLALLISLPLSRSAAFSMLDFLTLQINFDVVSYRTVAAAVFLQVGIALLVPQAAGILPVLHGSRVKVQDALNGGSVDVGSSRRSWLDRKLSQIKGLSRPLLISLRNTFRHKGRLALTLVTLTLGGAIFIATINVQASMESYIRKLGKYFQADVNLTMDAPYRISEIQEALKNIPEVENVEGWSYARCELLLDDDQGGDAVQLMAPPIGSKLIEPIMLQGRWLTPGDQNAIVLSERFISRFPNLHVGDTLRLRVNGDKTDWVVVGFFQLAGKSAGYVAYTGFDYLANLIHQPGQAVTYRILARQPNLSSTQQRALGAKLENYLQNHKFGVTDVASGSTLVDNSAEGLSVLTAFLMIMAILTALVGSIGLMGTMSMNVMDRTREIGVMRAIGASDRAVMSQVIVEGVLIGMISWVLGTLLALPISQMLSDTIHLAIFDARSEFTFTPQGPLAWLALVLLLSVLASVIPARSAARLTIREALAYE
jgi:putative ABC transport system permease protein